MKRVISWFSILCIFQLLSSIAPAGPMEEREAAEHEFRRFYQEYFFSENPIYTMTHWYWMVEYGEPPQEAGVKFFNDPEVKRRLKIGNDYRLELAKKHAKSAQAHQKRRFPTIAEDPGKQLERDFKSFVSTQTGVGQKPISEAVAANQAREEIQRSYGAAIALKQQQRAQRGGSSSAEEVMRSDPEISRLLSQRTQRILMTAESENSVRKMTERAWKLWREKTTLDLQTKRRQVLQHLVDTAPGLFTNSTFLSNENDMQTVTQDRPKAEDLQGAKFIAGEPGKAGKYSGADYYPAHILELKSGRRLIIKNTSFHAAVLEAKLILPKFSVDPLKLSRPLAMDFSETAKVATLVKTTEILGELEEYLNEVKWNKSPKFSSDVLSQLKSVDTNYDDYISDAYRFSTSTATEMDDLIFYGLEKGGEKYWMDRTSLGHAKDPLVEFNRIRDTYPSHGTVVPSAEGSRLEIVATKDKPPNRETARPQTKRFPHIKNMSEPSNKIPKGDSTLFIVKGPNTDKFFAMPMASSKYDIVSLNAEGSSAQGGVTSISPSGADGSEFIESHQGRYVSIPVPEGESLVEFSMKTEDGRVLTPEKDFVFLKEKSGPSMMVRLREGLSKDLISFEAKFKKASSPPLPNTLTNMDTSKFNPIIKELKAAKLNGLASLLENMQGAEPTVSIEHLESYFRQAGVYSFDPAPNIEQGTGQFAGFSKFVGEQEQLCYQCDGANQLFGRFLKLYFADNPNVEVKTVRGYVGPEKLTPSGGHAKTVVALGENVHYFDVTPGGEPIVLPRFTQRPTGFFDGLKKKVTEIAASVFANGPSIDEQAPPPETSQEMIEVRTANADDPFLNSDQPVQRVSDNLKNNRALFLQYLKGQNQRISPRTSQWMSLYRISGLYDDYLNGKMNSEQFFDRTERFSSIGVSDYEANHEGVQKYIGDLAKFEKGFLKRARNFAKKNPNRAARHPGARQEVIDFNENFVHILEADTKAITADRRSAYIAKAASPAPTASHCAAGLSALGKALNP